MNLLDVIIAAVLAVTTVYGLFRGFVRIAIGLAGLAVSLAFAFQLAERGPAWFAGAIDAAQLARLTAFLLVLTAGLLLTAVAARLAARLVRAAQIDWLDRLIGGLVGFSGAFLVVCGLLVGLTTFLPPGSGVLRNSRLVPAVLGVVDMAAAILPPDLADEYRLRREAMVDPHGRSA
jgi:membrane protein required for colicin V production